MSESALQIFFFKKGYGCQPRSPINKYECKKDICENKRTQTNPPFITWFCSPDGTGHGSTGWSNTYLTGETEFAFTHLIYIILAGIVAGLVFQLIKTDASGQLRLSFSEAKTGLSNK